MTIIVVIFCNKVVKEGDGSCHHLLLLLCNTTIEDVATLSLGLRLRQRLTRVWAKKGVKKCEDEDSHSQVNFHFGNSNPDGLPNL